MAGAQDDGRPITSINVTPLVDIILVVLIIFMATAPIIARRALNVDLPKAATHERAATEAMAVIYTAAHELRLQNQPVTLPELSRRLALYAQAEPDAHVTLSADKALGYGDVVTLLDAIRAAGVRRIGLEVVRR
jgi:biopolymer transport protein ExbD